jgi:molecular chaperone DnaK (HSP70)
MFPVFAAFALSIYLGIDFGSYYTRASTFMSNEHPDVATNYESERSTPTFLAFRRPLTNQTITPEFGDKALRLLLSRNSVGAGYLPNCIDMNESRSPHAPYVNRSQVNLSTIDLVALFFWHFVKSIAKGRPVGGITVVVPAHFTSPQREQLAAAVRIGSKLRKVAVIDDVDALCYVYANEKSARFQRAGRTVLFIDIGATSLKAYAVRFERLPSGKPLANRLAYAHDLENGGAILSKAICEHLMRKYGIPRGPDAENRRLFELAEKLKKQLTLTEEAALTSDALEFRLNRSELHSLSRSFSDAVIRVVNATFSKFPPDEVEVLGGSSRLPFLSELLYGRLGIRFGRSFNSDETLAIGAGYHAQFLRETSKFDVLYIYDSAPLYDVVAATANGSRAVCRAAYRCETSLVVDKGVRYIVLGYNESQLRPGLVTKSFGYAMDPQPSDIRISFSSHPFDVQAGCHVDPDNESNCTSISLVPLQTRSTVSSAYKEIVKAAERKARMASAHNKLESFVQRIEREITGNQTIQTFSSTEQRTEILLAISDAKKWIFEHADSATTAKNFTSISDRIRKLMSPIYRRIAENVTLGQVFASWSDTVNIVEWSLYLDWPSRGLVPKPEFLKLYRESVDWYQNATQLLNKAEAWQDPPITSKDLGKVGRRLYNEWLKVNGTAAPAHRGSASPAGQTEL